MTEIRANTPSITDRIRSVRADAPVVGVHFLGATPIFVLGEEALLFAPDSGERRVPIHAGAILSFAGDSQRLVTGGDDGKVIATDGDGAHREIAADPKSRWIDHVALGPDAAIAWSAGKTAHVQTGKGDIRRLDAPSTVAGLAFAPKGFRLAIAHYNGATLWFPNAQAAPERLEWKGSHLAVAFSPDGRFLITAMQEPMLHGWRIADGKDMRMSGYTARIRSFGWSAGGRFLATAGSEQLILWPFEGKDGPMGSRPQLWAPREVRVSLVACHPNQPVVAVGYADGMIMLVKIEDGAEILARRPASAPLGALGWDSSGAVLAFGDENGEAGVIAL